MVLDLVLMLSWIVIGIIGGVWLTRKGYLMRKMPPSDVPYMTEGFVDGGLFGRIFLTAMGGPLTLLAALVLPNRVRSTP